MANDLTMSQSQKNQATNLCGICREEDDMTIFTTLPCRHRFHVECIRSWVPEAKSCPMCRASLVYYGCDEKEINEHTIQKKLYPGVVLPRGELRNCRACQLFRPIRAAGDVIWGGFYNMLLDHQLERYPRDPEKVERDLKRNKEVMVDALIDLYNHLKSSELPYSPINMIRAAFDYGDCHSYGTKFICLRLLIYAPGLSKLRDELGSMTAEERMEHPVWAEKLQALNIIGLHWALEISCEEDDFGPSPSVERLLHPFQYKDMPVPTEVASFLGTPEDFRPFTCAERLTAIAAGLVKENWDDVAHLLRGSVLNPEPGENQDEFWKRWVHAWSHKVAYRSFFENTHRELLYMRIEFRNDVNAPGDQELEPIDDGFGLDDEVDGEPFGGMDEEERAEAKVLLEEKLNEAEDELQKALTRVIEDKRQAGIVSENLKYLAVDEPRYNSPRYCFRSPRSPATDLANEPSPIKPKDEAGVGVVEAQIDDSDLNKAIDLVNTGLAETQQLIQSMKAAESDAEREGEWTSKRLRLDEGVAPDASG
ncbi:hypothetical protein F5Y15DRAFT_413413 [Xylariaceae sp. FL0016]|nr:hypothetical protein F5Y15DRAFT_413413 [Xylariaceae sp. FL0016]